MKRLCCCLLLAVASAAIAATNLHPDPSFERTGVRGVARTGRRAGHLAVGGLVHWKAIGGKLPVEPFATYRATAWVRSKPGRGALHGLYVYSWNSFDWAWATSVRLGTIPDWKRIEATFLSPNDSVYFHPLAALDAANGQAWVDDVAIERTRSPEETMKSILARPPKDPQDIQFRVRYYLATGQDAKARALAAKGDAYTKADFAGVLAGRAKTKAERHRLAAEMVRYGGLGYGMGPQTFRQLVADATPDEERELFQKALVDSGFSVPAAHSYASFVSRELDDAMEAGCCGELERRLDHFAGRLAFLAKKAPKKAPGKKELDKVKQKLAAARAKVSERRKALGKCVVRIGGKTLATATHAIVTPDKPTPQETFAAKDLQAHLELLTGKEIPVVKDGKLGDQIPIVVGKAAATLKKLGVSIDFDGLGLEGIDIRTKGAALVLAGNRRGVLYAVYTFLENWCECRWFTPECSRIPKAGTFDIDFIRHRHIPPLEYRSTDYPCSRDPNWAARNKINGTQTRLDEKRGGKIAYSHFVHTFNSILNPDQHFATHPEYFSMIKGKRVGGRTQLCLTNPEVIEIAKKRVREWIKAAPAATIFSVSQNDWRNPCECPKCAALDKREGSHAGTMIHFVNAIARDIAKDHPDKLISTLAYQYTRTPPKHVRPEPNVTVRLCTIECDFAHPLGTSTHPQNRKFVTDIQGWHEKCNRLYIWDYIIDYAHSVMPWPNVYALKPNIRFFIDNGVKGVYEEACYFTKGSELAELRTWIIAKTMWNPEYDTDAAIDEFLAGFYGPAAPHIRKYINLMHKPVVENDSLYINIWTGPTAPYLNAQSIRQSVKLFDQAEKAVAKDPVLLHRVQVARLPILYVQIVTAKGGYREQREALVTAAGSENRRQLLDRFLAVARKEGLTTVREHRRLGALSVWVKRLNLQGKRIPVVRLDNGAIELAILPDLGGRIWKMTHKPSKREIIKRLTNPDGTEIPEAAGYEEYSQGEYRSPGWNERYRVSKQTKTSVTLTARLKNGLQLRRVLTLDPKKPIVHIDSTLANVSKAPVKAQLRSHPGFNVTDVQTTRVLLAGPGGKTRQKSLVSKEPLAEKDEFLRGADVPAGYWTVVDPAAGLRIRNRFDPKQIGQALLNRSGQQRRVNLELYAKPTTLKPGASQKLTHSIEIEPIKPKGK